MPISEAFSLAPPNCTGALVRKDNGDQDLRLECLRFAKGDIDKAKEMMAYVYGPVLTVGAPTPPYQALENILSITDHALADTTFPDETITFRECLCAIRGHAREGLVRQSGFDGVRK